MRTILNTLLVMAVMASAFSCIKEAVTGDNNPLKEDEARVILRLKTPGGFSAPQGRSLSYADENTISDIYVLVFDKTNTLVAIKQGQSVTSTPGSSDPAYSGTGSFAVTLEASRTTADTYKLVVLANSGSIIANTIGTDVSAMSAANKAYSKIIENIWAGISGPMYPSSGGTIPMWGESGQLVVEAGNNNQTLQLTRAIARIDVGVGKPSKESGTDVWSWNGKAADNTTVIPFALEHVYIISPNNRYSVMANTSLTADEPTIPAGTTAFTRAASESAFSFAATPSATGGFTSRDIYVPEADIKMTATGKPGDANHTARMAVVVGGRYDGSATETFYRLDFARSGNLMNVLRNHLYQFNIKSVSGDGYLDVETAYNSLAMNMTVDILEWDETDMGEIKFDGQYFLSVNQGEFEFTREAKTATETDNKLKIRTDVSGGWTATVWNDKAGTAAVVNDVTTGSPWLSVSPASGTGGGTPEMSLLMPVNASGIDRTAYVHIKAGRLTYVVTVKQSMQQPFGLRVSPTELYFDDQQRWFNPATQEWTTQTSADVTITWQPADIPCTITRANVAGAMGGVIPTTTDASGSYTFNFAPAAMTYNASDPFAEREVSATVKATNVYGETKYETVNIRQTRFDIVHNASTLGYMLNGGEHTFYVRSNVPWRVRSVSGSTEILANIAAVESQSGGINTNTGNLFSFKVISSNDILDKDKTVTVVLEDPTGKVAPKTIQLKGLVCGANGTAVPQLIGGNTYLTHMYGTKCWMVQNSKEGTSNQKTYPGHGEGELGYYYTWAQAAGACPDGWRLPSEDEFVALWNLYRKGSGDNTLKSGVDVAGSASRWWAGTQGTNITNGAFAGLFSGSIWNVWGSSGYWWSSTSNQFFYGNASGLSGPNADLGYYYSVRCVQD